MALTAVARSRFASLAWCCGAFVVLALVDALASARDVWFAAPEDLPDTLRQNSRLGIVALGMTFVASGGIDLSVGSLVALGGVVTAEFAGPAAARRWPDPSRSRPRSGVVSGLVIGKGRLPSFVATLAMMIGARGAALAATGERSVPLDRAAEGLRWLGRGRVLESPIPVLFLLVLFAAGGVLPNRTCFGRHALALGDGEIPTRPSSWHADRARWPSVISSDSVGSSIMTALPAASSMALIACPPSLWPKAQNERSCRRR